MKKFKKIILCTCLSIALLSTYGCSSSQDSSNTSTEASMTDATKSDVTDNTSEKVVEDTEKVSEEVVSEDTTENASEDTTTETVAKGDDKKTEATTEGKTESKKENKTENTPVTTQTATTQAQTTTQQSKPGNSGNNGNSQNNSQATTSHSHTWVNHTKTVHHDAQYEDQEVTKYKKEEHIFCNTCGADITDVGTKAHDEASGIIKVNCGTDENPWWVETTRCAGSHGSWISVPYTEIEKVKVKDAYDEEIVDYQYCSGCGQRK